MTITATAWAQTADDALEAFVRAQVGPDHRVEVALGELPPGTRLAPCHRIEPFLPPGTRLWGRSRIGVRCVSGARWTIMLPVTVRVFGQALVAARPIRANAGVEAADFHGREVELTAIAGVPITDPVALDGQMTTRPMRAGDMLMRHHLRARPTVAAGDPVRIRVIGQGFVVQSSGFALAAGSEGQPLRVRTESGKVLMGQLSGRTVDIRL